MLRRTLERRVFIDYTSDRFLIRFYEDRSKTQFLIRNIGFDQL